MEDLGSQWWEPKEKHSEHSRVQWPGLKATLTFKESEFEQMGIMNPQFSLCLTGRRAELGGTGLETGRLDGSLLSKRSTKNNTHCPLRQLGPKM